MQFPDFGYYPQQGYGDASPYMGPPGGRPPAAAPPGMAPPQIPQSFVAPNGQVVQYVPAPAPTPQKEGKVWPWVVALGAAAAAIFYVTKKEGEMTANAYEQHIAMLEGDDEDEEEPTPKERFDRSVSREKKLLFAPKH